MKKRLSVLVMVVMAFICVFALTACDPEVIEKLPEQILAEVFAQMDTDSYAIDADIMIGEGNETPDQQAKISYEGKKVKYELTLFEPETRYFDVENGTYYMYVEEPDYGWVKEEIDKEYYELMADRFFVERNDLLDAAKYSFVVDGETVNYQLKAEYLPKGITSVSVIINADVSFTMTMVDGEGDAAMVMKARFYNFGKVTVDLPVIEEINAEEKLEELENYFIKFRNRNTTIEWNKGENFYRLMARVEDGHEYYMLYSKEIWERYDPETGFSEFTVETTEYFDFDRNTEVWTSLYIGSDGGIVSNETTGEQFNDLLESKGYSIWSYVMDGDYYNYNADIRGFELNDDMANTAYEAYNIVNCKAYLNPMGSDVELLITMELSSDTHSVEMEVRIYNTGNTEFDFPVVA